MIEKLRLFCIRLEGAFRFYARAVNKLLPLLPPLSILIKAIKFGIFALIIRLSSFLLHHYLFRNHRDLRLESDSLSLSPYAVNSLGVNLFFHSFSIFNKEIFSLFAVSSGHPFRDFINLGLETELCKFLLVLFRFCSLNYLILFFLSPHTPLIKFFAVIWKLFVNSAITSDRFSGVWSDKVTALRRRASVL